MFKIFNESAKKSRDAQNTTEFENGQLLKYLGFLVWQA